MRDTVWSRTLATAQREELLASDTLPAVADVVVVGAGLVGLCAALSLRRRGAGRVVVLDRGAVCSEASGASAGGLWPAHECLSMVCPEVARRAAGMHTRLREEFPCDYVSSGLLEPVAGEQAAAAAERANRIRRAGFRAEMLGAADVQGLEPQLCHAGPALHCPDDGSIHPLRLAAAISSWLRSRGVRICLGERVERVSRGGTAVLARGSRIEAGAVVIAAGAWTPLLTRVLGWSPPIRPVRGVLMATEAFLPGTLRTVVVGDRYYYWQLARGPLAGGGSEEEVGFERGVSPQIAADIERDWAERFPELAGVSFSARWSGFRPRCDDLHPVIGRVPGGGRAYVSAGHFRKGILLAPLSGELLAREMAGEDPWEPARAMRPGRFPPHDPPD